MICFIFEEISNEEHLDQGNDNNKRGWGPALTEETREGEEEGRQNLTAR